MNAERELEPKLTDRQQAFILEYLKDFNGTQAAIRAGYAESGAPQEGHRLLTNADIRREIDLHFADLGLTADRILSEQMAMAFADFNDYVLIDEGGGVQAMALDRLTPGKTRAIKKIKETRKLKENPDGSMFVDSTLEYELHDKAKALDVLAKQVSGRERITAPDLNPLDAPGFNISPDDNPSQMVIHLLTDALQKAQEGRLDPRVGDSITHLATALLKAREQSELEERLAALENAMKNQTPDSGLDLDL